MPEAVKFRRPRSINECELVGNEKITRSFTQGNHSSVSAKRVWTFFLQIFEIDTGSLPQNATIERDKRGGGRPGSIIAFESNRPWMRKFLSNRNNSTNHLRLQKRNAFIRWHEVQRPLLTVLGMEVIIHLLRSCSCSFFRSGKVEMIYWNSDSFPKITIHISWIRCTALPISLAWKVC